MKIKKSINKFLSLSTQKLRFFHFSFFIFHFSFLSICLILQFFFGEFDIRIIRAPLNIISGAVMILSLIALSLFRKNRFYSWLSGIPFSVSLIITIGILAVFMGLIPQYQKINPHDNDFYAVSGLRSITTSWYFVLIYLFLLLSLGATIIKRFYSFNIKDYAFYLNHIGLWAFLFAAGFGAADRERYSMYVYEGKTESNAYNSDGILIKLPLTITLNDFDMEEYTPESIVVNNKGLKMKPEDIEGLRLTNDYSTVMTSAEPKRFVSDLNVFMHGKEEKHIMLEVNNPYRAGSWMIYQYGYDSKAGKSSAYSIFEIVYDPWLYGVYAGILLLAAGSVCMLWSGGRNKKYEK